MEVNRSMEVQAPGRHTRIVEMSVQQASTKTRQHSHALDTRLQGRWLLLARAGWVVLVVLTLTIFFASLPVYMARQQTDRLAQVRRPHGGVGRAHARDSWPSLCDKQCVGESLPLAGAGRMPGLPRSGFVRARLSLVSYWAVSAALDTLDRC